jgi:hypothetical protein
MSNRMKREANGRTRISMTESLVHKLLWGNGSVAWPHSIAYHAIANTGIAGDRYRRRLSSDVFSSWGTKESRGKVNGEEVMPLIEELTKAQDLAEALEQAISDSSSDQGDIQ